MIAVEACAGAHHWARRLRALGFAPSILAAHLVEPFLRGRIHTVPIKSTRRQGGLVVHPLREGYKSERAWLGMTPSQDSSGGKTRLGRITKRGDVYLRTLLIQTAKSAVMTAHRRGDPISQWAARLKERVGWQKACVALGHKHARIVWARLVRGRPFDAKHLSSFPAPPGAPAVMTAVTTA